MPGGESSAPKELDFGAVGKDMGSNYLKWKNAEATPPPPPGSTMSFQQWLQKSGISSQLAALGSTAELADRDFFRRGAVRFLGYANEVGEAFRPIVPRWAVNATYAVAGTYVCADAGWRAHTQPPTASHGKLVEAGDTLAWQTLASIAIPGAVINRIVWSVGKLAPGGSWLPTLAGLAAIPLIIKPIDHGVDWVLDNTVRTLYASEKPKPH